MSHFLTKFFKRSSSKKNEKKTQSRKEFIKYMKTASNLSHKINKTKDVLYDIEYKLLKEQENDVFISLKDFINLMAEENLSIDRILSVCKHISDIKSDNLSYIDVSIIEEDGHLVLCKNPKKCDKHSYYRGNTVRLVTWRMS